MGFFWGCNCCLDYYIATTEHIIGKKFGTGTSEQVFITAHGLSTPHANRKQIAADTEFVWMAGSISSVQAIQKYDKTGTLIESLPFAAANIGQPNGFARDQNGNFGIGGSMTTPTERFRYVNSAGTRQWGYNSGTFGAHVAFNEDDEVLTFFQTAGITRKFDAGGSIIWESSTTDIPTNQGQTLQFDLEGNVLAGRNDGTVSFGKYDGDGNQIWASTSHTCRTDAVAVGPDNEILMGGRLIGLPVNSSKVIKFDADGNILAQETFVGVNVQSIAVAPDGRIVVVGQSSTVPLVGVGFHFDNDLVATDSGFEYLDAAAFNGIGSVIWNGGLITPWNPLV